MTNTNIESNELYQQLRKFQVSLIYNVIDEMFIDSQLRNLVSADYADIEKFFDDTDNGVLPFAFMYLPTTDPTDVIYARLTAPLRSVQYRGGAIRDI